MTHSREKCRTERQTGKQTARQTNGDYIGPSVGRGSNKEMTTRIPVFPDIIRVM